MNEVQTGITAQPSDAIDGAVSVAEGSSPNLIHLERRADELADEFLQTFRGQLKSYAYSIAQLEHSKKGLLQSPFPGNVDELSDARSRNGFPFFLLHEAFRRYTIHVINDIENGASPAQMSRLYGIMADLEQYRNDYNA